MLHIHRAALTQDQTNISQFSESHLEDGVKSGFFTCFEITCWMNVPKLGKHKWALLENCSQCVLTEACALEQLGSPLHCFTNL